jgi:hypothetical protein
LWSVRLDPGSALRAVRDDVIKKKRAVLDDDLDAACGTRGPV